MEILQSDDALRDEIINDANVKADRILKKAQKDADEILKNSDVQANDIEKEFKESSNKSAENQVKLIKASIDLEVKKSILNITGDLINEIFDKTAAMIVENKTIDYKNFILKLTALACEKIDSSSYIIEVNINELKKITKESLLNIKLKSGKIQNIIENNSIPGLVVYSEDRKLASHICLDGFMELLKSQERTNIYKILIEG